MKNTIRKAINSIGYDLVSIKRQQVEANKKRIGAENDDYDWTEYNDEYSKQLEMMEHENTLKLVAGDYNFEGGSLVKKSGIKPLHANHRLVYETVGMLKPSTVIEAGCGGGDHVYNLSLLLDGVDVTGYERSEQQINYGYKRSPELKGKLHEFDLTMPFSNKLKTADIVYTQAVLMHIQTGNGHLTGLANVFRMARKQVILMENWTRHPFLSDIKRLHALGMIDWPDLHFYFRRSPELGNRPHLMVVSRDGLDLEPLSDYSILL